MSRRLGYTNPHYWIKTEFIDQQTNRLRRLNENGGVDLFFMSSELYNLILWLCLLTMSQTQESYRGGDSLEDSWA